MYPTRPHILVLTALLAGVAAAAPAEEKPWWLSSHRMLQTNLREIDAAMDLDRYVADMRQFGADAVLLNVGGIVANYPSDLPYHFSKLNQQIAARHPEWLYVSERGEQVSYNGQVQTCVNSGYSRGSTYCCQLLRQSCSCPCC